MTAIVIWQIVFGVAAGGLLLSPLLALVLALLAPRKVRAWDASLNGPEGSAGGQGHRRGLLRHPYILLHHLRHHR